MGVGPNYVLDKGMLAQPPAVLSAPVQSAPATATTGGTFAAGTYQLVVTALGPNNTETTKSNEQSIVTTGTTSTITANWGAVAGAVGYKVYMSPVGGAAGSENTYVIAGNVTTLTVTAPPTAAGTPPLVNNTGSATPFSPGEIVSVGSLAYSVQRSITPGAKNIGVCMELLDSVKANTGKAFIDVRILGIARVIAGGTVNIGDRITNDANARAVTVSNAVGMVQSCGVALTAAVNPGDVIDVLLTPFATVNTAIS